MSEPPWPTSMLGDAVDILDHLRVPVNEEERAKRLGDVPYYGANGLQGWIDRPLFNEPLLLMAEDGGYFDDFASRPIAYRVDGPSWVNNHAHILRAKPEFAQAFVFWNLVHKDIRRHIAGGTRDKLTQAALRAIEILNPPLPEQRAIAAVLDTLDDAIQKTEQIIAKLKQVKQGLLHDLLTRGIDDNGELRDPERHPEQFQDSPLGRIPKGWEVRAMPRMFARVAPGPRQDEESCSASGRVPVVDQSEQGFIGFWSGAPGVHASPEKPVVTFANHTCAVRWVTFPCSAIQNVFFMRGSSGISTRFLYYAVRGRVPQQVYQGHWPLLQEQRFCVPPEPEQERLIRTLDDSEFRINAEENTLVKLQSLKAGLSEDLLTGRVRTTSLPEVAG